MPKPKRRDTIYAHPNIYKQTKVEHGKYFNLNKELATHVEGNDY